MLPGNCNIPFIHVPSKFDLIKKYLSEIFFHVLVPSAY